MTPGPAPRSAVVGLQGTVLTDAERALFTRLVPAGYILFARNCVEPGQVRALVRSVRELHPDRHVPVLIDQEGGRVMRLRPPHWPALPAAGQIGALAERDEATALEAARWQGQAIGAELRALDIDIDCAPCLDVARAETTTAIGDRCFAADPGLVARLGRAFMDGLASQGVLPVIKHLPGHGRARVDSHERLPVVETAAEVLAASDLAPFRACADAPLAMTAHVVYSWLDPERPATHSPAVIREVIRGLIGFRGILLSDDLGMQALRGPPEDRARRAVAAGCDLALYCNGTVEETEAVLANLPELPEATGLRLQALLADAARRRSEAEPTDALARLDQLMAIA